MMKWLFGQKHEAHEDEIAKFEARREQNVQAVRGTRLNLEMVVEKMKKDKADAAMGK